MPPTRHRPVLLQDFDEEADQSGAGHWQLFLDLLLVAAASSIADGFKSELTLSSFGEFAVLYIIIVNGWMLYTHDICSRFQDVSFSHAMLLLVYCLGFGTSSVNVEMDWAEAPGFAIGALILRCALFMMLAKFACCLPNARYTAQCIAIIVGLASVGLVVAVIFNVDPMVVKLGLLGAAAMEFFGEALIVSFGQIQQVVPVSIDHTKERLGALMLTMMGETVLSVTISFREIDEEGIIPQENRHLEYWVLGLSFLLIFMFLLLFFHLQPSTSELALQVSHGHKIALMQVHKVLGLALLSVGVCIKVVVEAVLLKGEDGFSSFVGYLFGTSVGAALFILYVIRLLHYRGRQTIHFGRKVYTRGDNPYVDRIAHAWRHTLLLASLLPIIGMATGLTMNDPLMATALHAGLVFAMVVAEVFYTHAIEKQIPEPVTAEQQPLVSSS